MAQVRGIGPRLGGCLVLFCVHRVNRVYGALLVLHGHVTAPYRLSYHYYFSNCCYLYLLCMKLLLYFSLTAYYFTVCIL